MSTGFILISHSISSVKFGEGEIKFGGGTCHYQTAGDVVIFYYHQIYPLNQIFLSGVSEKLSDILTQVEQDA